MYLRIMVMVIDLNHPVTDLSCTPISNWVKESLTDFINSLELCDGKSKLVGLVFLHS